MANWLKLGAVAALSCVLSTIGYSALADPISIGVAIAGGALAAGAVTKAAVFGITFATVASAKLFVFAVVTAASLALTALQKFLAPKPSTPNFNSFGQDAQSRTRLLRQPITAWEMVYGEVAKSGPLTFATVTNNENDLHLVITVACHECEEFTELYLNDDVIFVDQLNGSGVVSSGKYNGKVKWQFELGTGSTNPFPDLTSAASAWTANHIQEGFTKCYVKLTHDIDLFPTGIPNLRFRLKGKPVLDTRDSVTRWSPNPALCIRDYMATPNDEGGLGFTSGEFDTTVLNASANTSDEIVTTKTVAMTVSSVNTGSDYLELSFPNSDTILQMQTGDRVEMTTTGSLPGGLSTLTSYFIRVMRSRSFGGVGPRVKLATSYANAIAGTFIDITSAGSGTHTITKDGEPRYTCNGVVLTDKTPDDVLNDMRTAMAGRIVPVGGTWLIEAGAWKTPTITFAESDMRDAIILKTRHGRRERFNAVKGVFISVEQNDQPTDYPPVTDATYEANDNTVRIFRDLDLPFTCRSQTAQRIARIELERHRREISAEVKLTLTGLQVKAIDTVMLNNTRFGWSSKTFEIAEWKMTVEGDTPIIGVDIKVREADASIFTFDETTQENQMARPPATTLPDPTLVPAPTDLALTSGTNTLFLKADGTVVSRIKVAWTDSVSPFVAFYEILFKKTADADFEPTITVLPDVEVAYIFDAQEGEEYTVKMRAVNRLGIASDFVTDTHTVVGKTESPSDITAFSAQQNGDLVVFRWTSIPDVDRAGVDIRRRANGTSTSFNDSIEVTKEEKGTKLTTAVIPPGNWDFLIKARDTSGNLSINAAVASLVVTNTSDIIIDSTEHPRWPGTRTDFVKHDVSGRLIPDSNTLASAMSDAELWDQMVFDVVSNAYYEAKEIDLGFDATGVRVFRNSLSGVGPGEAGQVNEFFQIDYKNNAGSYDGFEDWEIGLIDFRFLKGRMKLTNSDGADYLEQFEIIADVDEREEFDTGVTVSIGGTAIVFDTQFHTVPNIQVQVDGATALFPVKSSVTTSGFTITVYDTGGNDVGGTVDWRAIGA